MPGEHLISFELPLGQWFPGVHSNESETNSIDKNDKDDFENLQSSMQV